MQHGMVKPVPIMLAKVPGDTPNITGKGTDIP